MKVVYHHSGRTNAYHVTRYRTRALALGIALTFEPECNECEWIVPGTIELED